MIGFAYFIFFIFLLGIVLFSWIFVKAYEDKHDSELLTTCVTIISLIIALLCLFLIPVDVYNVSSSLDDLGQFSTILPADIADRGQVIKVFYYVLYSLTFLFMFFIIPFAYFYYEERDESVNVHERAIGACKYTTILVIIVFVILIVGLFLDANPIQNFTNDFTNSTLASLNSIFSGQNKLESSLNFAIACFTMVGFVVWIGYTAYGLSILPIGLIKGKKSVDAERSEIQAKLEEAEEKQRALENRKKKTKRDEARLKLLEKSHKLLSKQTEILEMQRKGCRRCLFVLKPFYFLFGIAFALLTLLYVATVLLTVVEKFIFANISTGFVGDTWSSVPNPMDKLFTILSKVFPFDYILLACLVVYILFCTMAGIVYIGIRLAWIKVYPIRARRTAPQALLLLAVLLMFVILSMNFEILQLAPQYVTWGSQHYKNSTTGSTIPCDINGMPNCTMTQIAIIVNTINARLPFFGLWFAICNVAFFIVWVIGAVYAFFRGRESNADYFESDDDSDDEGLYEKL